MSHRPVRVHAPFVHPFVRVQAALAVAAAVVVTVDAAVGDLQPAWMIAFFLLIATVAVTFALRLRSVWADDEGLLVSSARRRVPWSAVSKIECTPIARFQATGVPWIRYHFYTDAGRVVVFTTRSVAKHCAELRQNAHKQDAA